VAGTAAAKDTVQVPFFLGCNERGECESNALIRGERGSAKVAPMPTHPTEMIEGRTPSQYDDGT
jgi:hypothetical protein